MLIKEINLFEIRVLSQPLKKEKYKEPGCCGCRRSAECLTTGHYCILMNLMSLNNFFFNYCYVMIVVYFLCTICSRTVAWGK